MNRNHDRLNSKRRVSVLTPAHDTPLSFLKRAFSSLEAQSCGFSRIQWVIVLHNCSEEYCLRVTQLLRGNPNVLIVRENAEGTGVSYARNATLSLADGEYLFFLDADDEMKPECIEEVTSAMDYSRADTALFTADVIRQDGVEAYWADVASCDGSLILEAGDPRIGKSMWLGGLNLWTRCYRRDFIEREHILFDENSRYGEDYLFNIQATGTAKRLIVLPGVCGYTYYADIGMTVNIVEEMRQLPPGLFLFRLYRYGKMYGLDLTNVVWRLAAVFGRICLFSDMPAGIKNQFIEDINSLVMLLLPPRLENESRQETADKDYRFVRSLLSLKSQTHAGKSHPGPWNDSRS